MHAKIGKRLLATLEPKEKPFEVFDTKLPGFILRVQPSGVMSYYVRYYLPDGRRERMKIGRHGGAATKGSLTADKARDQANTILADARRGIDPRAAKKKARIKTLAEFLDEEYGPWVLANRKTGKETLARLRAAFPTLLKKNLDEITPKVIDRWQSSRLKGGTKPATINRDLAALKSVMSKAVDSEDEKIKVNPIAKVRPSKVDPNPKVRFLSDDEEDRLREALKSRDDRIKAGRTAANAWRKERGYPAYRDLHSLPFPDHLHPMVLVSLNTGLRRGELFSLTWSNVDFKAKTLTVVGYTSKNMKTRHVPMNEEVVSTLKTWKKQPGKGELVFPGKEGERLNNVKKAWKNLLKDAGIINFRWHDMRHHFASMLVMGGIDLNTVRELLGHSGLKMTLRYAHLAPEHKAAAVAVLARNGNSKTKPTAIQRGK